MRTRFVSRAERVRRHETRRGRRRNLIDSADVVGLLAVPDPQWRPPSTWIYEFCPAQLSATFCAKTKEAPVYQMLRAHLTIFYFTLHKYARHYYYYYYYYCYCYYYRNLKDIVIIVSIIPAKVTSSNSLQTFKTKLKSSLFLASFP